MNAGRIVTSPLLDSLATSLEGHVSPINARVIMERVRRVIRDPSRVADDEREKLLTVVRVSAQLFVANGGLDALVASVARALQGPETVLARCIAVTNEEDLRSARLTAREMCLQLGASNLVVQRVATVVSELARNIVSYTPGGSIDLEPLQDMRPPRLRVTAEDRGPGIPNLDRILSGNYRSKTGLGRGLLGVKQLMERFEVRTGASGTRITAEATLA